MSLFEFLSEVRISDILWTCIGMLVAITILLWVLRIPVTL